MDHDGTLQGGIFASHINIETVPGFPDWQICGNGALATIDGYELQTSQWAYDVTDRFVWAVDDFKWVESDDPEGGTMVPINMACGIADDLREAVHAAQEVCRLLVKTIGPG